MKEKQGDLILKKNTRDELEKKLAEKIEHGPYRVQTSTWHRPGKTYISINNYRVYFTTHSDPKINRIYHNSQLYSNRRKFISNIKRDLKECAEDAVSPVYWLHLLKPKRSLPILLVLSFFFINTALPVKAKKDIRQKFWTVMTVASGYKGEVEVLDNGHLRLEGKRRVIDGTWENVDLEYDPVSGTGFIERHPISGEKITGYISVNGKEITCRVHGEEGRSRVFKGKVVDSTVIWDKPQGSGNRKIYGHKIERKRKGEINIIDLTKRNIR